MNTNPNRKLNIRSYNRKAWNEQVEKGNTWTLPVDEKTISRARDGDWEIYLTPTKPVPRNWFPPLQGTQILCLASGGGQQGPILAAAGAAVTVLDNSPKQLAQDRKVAQREDLAIITVEGDMRDLSVFGDAQFDLIVHPVSNVFVPDVHPVWREAFRVLKPGGSLLAGFMNPVHYLFDFDEVEENETLNVRYAIPYSDLVSLSDEKLAQYMQEGWPLEFGHSLEDQIGGQIQAGFTLNGFYEDYDYEFILSKYHPSFIATRATKPDGA